MRGERREARPHLRERLVPAGKVQRLGAPPGSKVVRRQGTPARQGGQETRRQVASGRVASEGSVRLGEARCGWLLQRAGSTFESIVPQPVSRAAKAQQASNKILFELSVRSLFPELVAGHRVKTKTF